MNKSKKIGFDLYCGVGGMSLGFEQAGFHVVGALDLDHINVETHRQNFRSCQTLELDVLKTSGQHIYESLGLGRRRLDVLFGGPPCQGFSLIGKRDLNDPRNKLIGEFARLIRELRPRYFVLENVSGLLAGASVNILSRFINRVKRCGYKVTEPVQILDAHRFGVPQSRKRVFVLGYDQGENQPEYPDAICDEALSAPTVLDAIGDLPDIEEFEELFEKDILTKRIDPASTYARMLHGLSKDPEDKSPRRTWNGDELSGCLRTCHTKEIIARFKKTPPGSYEPISRFYRLSFDGLAPTLRAGTGPSNGSYTAARPIHPRKPRCITVREAARLHSYPDWFKFHPTIWHGFRQVGNSVPPWLARAVAKKIHEALS